MLVQAIHDRSLGLLQLPGFTPENIKLLRHKRVSNLANDLISAIY